jgi:hypothetical protein
MGVIVPGTRRRTALRPLQPGPGRPRKVGIVGNAKLTLELAPWEDGSWEWWAQASVVNSIPQGRADLLIDLHPPHCHQVARKNGYQDYYGFLKTQHTPIFMADRYPEIPASIRYPREKIWQLWPYQFGSQTAALIALALMQGVSHLGFWGCEYSHDTEYASQRPHTLLWVGIAIGMGVQIVAPRNSPLLLNKEGDYPADTHATQEMYDERKKVYAQAAHLPHFAAEALKPLVTPDDFAEAARIRAAKNPEWVKAVQSFDHEQMPDEILELEQRQRDERKREEVGA